MFCVFRWCCVTFGGVALVMDWGSDCTTIAVVETSGWITGDVFSLTTKLQMHFVSIKYKIAIKYYLIKKKKTKQNHEKRKRIN